MISQRLRGVYNLLAVAQCLMVTGLFWLLFAVFGFGLLPGTGMFFARYVGYWLVIIAALTVEVLSRDPNKLSVPLYDRSLLRQFPIVFRQTAAAIVALLVFLALTKDQAISRTFLIVFVPGLYLVLFWSNAWLPPLLVKRLFRQARENRTVLVGPPERVERLIFWLERKAQLGVRVVGLISDDQDQSSVSSQSIPRLGGPDQLEALFRLGEVTQIILLQLSNLSLAHRLIPLCQKYGVRLLIVNDLAEQLGHPTVSFVDDGLYCITLHEEPLENPLNRVLKRGLDLAIAIPVVLVLLPILAVLVWVIHRLQSPGPLLHRQERAGLQNRRFVILKFRTMHPTPKEAEDIPATKGDERVFPAGRWLRRFSVDEIPQFINVLAGEMSVVGPRPHLLEHNRQFAEMLANYHLRTFIKPGITGLAQVRGFRGEARTREDIGARLQSDLVYLENWSLSLEIGIILRTMWQMLLPPKTAV